MWSPTHVQVLGKKILQSKIFAIHLSKYLQHYHADDKLFQCGERRGWMWRVRMAQMTPSSQLVWARKSSKHLSKRKVRHQSGWSSVNCKNTISLTTLHLNLSFSDKSHSTATGLRWCWRFSTGTKLVETSSWVKWVYLCKTLTCTRNPRRGESVCQVKIFV